MTWQTSIHCISVFWGKKENGTTQQGRGKNSTTQRRQGKSTATPRRRRKAAPPKKRGKFLLPLLLLGGAASLRLLWVVLPSSAFFRWRGRSLYWMRWKDTKMNSLHLSVWRWFAPPPALLSLSNDCPTPRPPPPSVVVRLPPAAVHAPPPGSSSLSSGGRPTLPFGGVMGLVLGCWVGWWGLVLGCCVLGLVLGAVLAVGWWVSWCEKFSTLRKFSICRFLVFFFVFGFYPF